MKQEESISNDLYYFLILCCFSLFCSRDSW